MLRLYGKYLGVIIGLDPIIQDYQTRHGLSPRAAHGFRCFSVGAMVTSPLQNIVILRVFRGEAIEKTGLKPVSTKFKEWQPLHNFVLVHVFRGEIM